MGGPRRRCAPTGWTCCGGGGSSTRSESAGTARRGMEARDFSCWIRLTVKQRRQTSRPRAAQWSQRGAGPPNPVTGKPGAGDGYAPASIAHSETVLRRFYDFHRDAGSRPILNPFPLDMARRSGRANAHHNPMEAVAARAGRAVPADGAAADPAGDSRRAVQRAVRGAAVEPGPGAGGVLDLHRGPGVGAAGGAPLRRATRASS